MSFFNNFIQNVSNTVSNLNLSPKRFPFGARQESAAGLQRTESAGGAAAAAAARGRGSPLQGAAAAPPVGSVGRTASLPAPCGPGTPKSPRSSQKKRRAKLLLATSTQKRDILYETSNSGVQETDGSFFEAFASLPWRQENRRMQSLKEEEEQKDRPPPSEATAGLQPKRVVVSQQERENLYVEVLYTVKHKVGATTSEHSSLVDELNDYTQEAFHFSRDEHQRMMTIASDEKPPIVILNLVVVEASGLEAKDAD
ncbi:uncharacterized protein LOC122391222, partial [Amphibalanus amphitrite]|uniref:uncharacterized protein LOC122391222 n=1 Tax=Amphibalanus amphitrite TaxID=1232801 RepID=UPI001C912109